MDAFTSSGKYLGTDRIERPLTNEESSRLGKLLRQHGFAGASMIALRFAHKLTRSKQAAGDLLGKANLRLVCTGWDPGEVALAKRMCRVVWSEWTHELEETDAARRAEENFLREEQATGELAPAAPVRGDPLHQKREPAAPSHEQLANRLEQEKRDDARRAAWLEERRADVKTLRARLAKDETNVVFLENATKGNDDLEKMVAESGRPLSEFYAAQKRRVRAVKKLLAEKNGVKQNDEETE